MDQLIQTLIIGFADGLIFALVALGYTLVYGIIELINFAHGDVFMIGSLIAFALIAPTAVGGLGFFQITAATPVPLMIGEILATLAITIVLTAGLNMGIERLAYRPLRHAPKLAPLIAAIGMSFVLQNVGVVLAGSNQRTIENIFPTTNLLSSFGITAVSITAGQVFVGVVTLPLLFGLSWFVASTRQGRAMRATAQDPDTAGLMGVDVNRTIAITFIIGGALAGAAGVVQILYNNVTVWNLGFRFGLISFTAAVLGGIGNMRGAVLGAMILGVVSAISDRYISANWTQAIVFGVLIAILVFKPSGLMGQQLADRA
ncbi:MAG: branched-chain amino acid transport system permease protein [Chloroflexota bacterium]|jgi:branched-chain amino acid transport system permease protein|nr:branched-chain amino acid transport system permease protein [Chloroflexota bacterium]MEA2652962.1 branched-chain amino acid transport system permease protein [Chloroflexota bacterium]HEV7603879.1 branched-chain amino acid ABC transporter permease [Candidatus Limnocylindrales bacterium]